MKKMASGLTRRHICDTGKAAVKYTPCAKDHDGDEELEEIAVVSDQQSVKMEAVGTITANGPRIIPGHATYSAPSDRTRLIGQRLSSSGNKINLASPIYTGKDKKSTSKQSLLEIVSNKLHFGEKKRHFSKESVAFIHKTSGTSDLEITRKVRDARRKEIKTKFEKYDNSSSSSDKQGCKWTFVFDPSGRLCYYWSMVVSVAFLYNLWVIIYRFALQEIKPNTYLPWFTLDYLADLLYVMDIAFHFRTGYLEDGVLQTDAVKLRQHYINSTMFYIDCLCLLPLDFLYLSIGPNSFLRCFRLVKIYRFWTFLDRTERHTNYPNVFRSVSMVHYLMVIFHWNACIYFKCSQKFDSSISNWDRDEQTSSDVVRNYLESFYWSTLTLSNIGDLPRPRTNNEYLFVIVELVFGLLLFATVLGQVANIVTNVSAARKEFQAKLDNVKTFMNLRRVPDHLQAKVIKWFDYLWMSKKSADEEKVVSCLPDKLKAEIAIHVHLDTLKRVEIFQNTEAGFLCELVLRLRPVLFSPGDYICRKGEVGKEMYIVARGRLQVVADNGKTVLATLKAGSYFGEISILNMGTAGNRRTASVKSVGYSDLFCLSKQDMWDVLQEYPAARVRLEAIAVKRLEKYKKAPLEKAFNGRMSAVSKYLAEARHVAWVDGLGQENRHGSDLIASLLEDKLPIDIFVAAMSRSHSTPGLIESAGKIPIEKYFIDRNPSLPICISPLPKASDAGTPPPSTSSANNGDEDKLLNDVLQTKSNFPKSFTTSSVGSYATDSSFSDKKSPGITSPSNILSPITSPKPDTTPLSPNIYEHSPTSIDSLMNFHLTLPSQDPYMSLPSPTTATLPRDPSQEILVAEIKRLRERLVTLETENASMSIKLSQQQWEVEHRLAEIEMHICGSSSVGSGGSGDEKNNRESVI
uniref:Eka-cGMP gated channel alpha 3 protein n=1 Tax=Euperipatoides kanangrensis TaxID=488523 RepID=A0A0F7VK59_9BILA|nr:Eka-cGMP gated channel alpha 3 protein [Euperipatoides kanangrensis]